MSTSHASAQDTQTAQANKRRKRKERAAKARTPEPKDIVSGAGQPLDLSVRRELEEQLGHDFSQVRLHTDRDAGQLTELLGADAVAVGQDIFFREGAYRPGTADGQRLLAHELLHTVQNPHGLGALRAGRDLGAVSLPQQAMEQEAESAAQDLVRESADPSAEIAVRPEEGEVEPGQATPGWLRYATVDADRSRAEKLDPATLVDRLANGVLRSLRGDPHDLSGRVRWELARLSPQLQDSVLDQLETRLLTPEYDRLLDLAEEAEATPIGFHTAEVPAPEIDLFEELGVERVQWKRKEEGKRGSKEKQAEDSREEQNEAKARDEKRGSDQSRASADAAAEDKEAAGRKEQEDERAQSRERAEQEQQQEEEKQGQDRQRVDQAADERAQGQQEGAEEAKEQRKAQRDREEQDPEQANTPGADKRKRKDDAKKPADGSKQEDVDPKAKGQPGPVRPEKVDERADERDSALSEHGLHEKDEDEDEPREEEKPLGLEAGAENEIGGEEDRERDKGGAAKGETELKPEDYLPDADLDLSSVPTADQMQPGEAEPSLPSFPTPPPTKAERVEQEREKESQEEDEDAAGPEAKAPGEDEGPIEGEAPKPDGGPAAEAQDRGEKDLQPEKPTDQEVGPDPETAEKEQQEPEAEKQDPAQQQEQDDDGAKAAKLAGDDKDEDSADGEEKRGAKDAQDERRELSERGRQEEQRGEGGQPQGAAADKPAGPAAEASSGSPPGPAAMRPAGAQPQKTPAEDRNPSPAARREAEPPKSEREAAGPKSQVPKETGSGAAPRGTVGESEPAGPTAAAGPGAAPSVAQAAVGPAGEQAENPGAMGAPAPEGTQAKPEASLEKDGGGCGPPEPAAEKDDGGKGGCGGGGGEAAPEEKQQDPPDVSGQDPKAAVQTVSKLAPDQAAAAMPGVNAATDKKIGEEQQRLDANPPKRERPSGAPRTQSAPPEAAAPAPQVTGKVEKLGPENEGEKQRAKGSEKAEGQKPTDNTPSPPLPVAKELSADEAENVEAAADAVPTVDPELRNKTVGPAPKIKLEGASDPKRTDDQAKALKEKQSEIQKTGREDVAKPMGEDQIFPDAPQEQLVGKATGRAGGKGGGEIKAGSAPKPGVGAVAKQERGSEIQGAAGQAQGDLVAKEKEHKQGEQQAKQEKQSEIDREVAQNAEKQTTERGRAAQEAQRERENWRSEQDKKIEDADKKSEKEHTAKNKEIVKARDDKDKEVGDRKDKDNQQIDTERENAEKEAEKKKEEKKPSGGFFGWLADKVKGFFSALLEAVTKVFEAARAAVNGIIDKFKEFANKAIDFVRDLAIKAINVLADALIAIGDVLLAAFPELRDKFRKAIEGLRDKAIAAVNKLADGLKKAVNALLDALAAGLNKLLDVLEAGIKAVIKIYQAVILGAIKFAQAAIEALGKFAALVADIAPDPGGWLKKAGSAAKTGITDHLWGAIKTGVKRWFDAKVEGILGLGKAVINALVKGCVSIKQIGKMAWDAIIASLPMMIASIVIEKVVSMIVPAAGAILTIVQGLMAAWQSLSSILSAFSKFWAYLKAVKAGPAACLFAEAVAAGIVALLDFIANFLMIRLSAATKGVGKRLKAMAQKIMKGLKKTGKGAKKAAGTAVNKARGAIRNAKQALRKPPVAPKPKAKPSPNPKSPPKPKDAPTPKAPPKPQPTPAKPKDTKPDPAKDRTPDKGPGPSKDRTPDKSPDATKDKTPQPSKKKKEIEGPKPTKPKKPKSPLGNALSKAKKAVKSALKKVRNAAKTLGRKLKKSKPGKAMRNSASKLRNIFKKKRDRLRDHKKKQTDQKKQNQDKRKKDEKTKESKEARLQKIVARIKPRLGGMLAKGTPRPVLGAALTAMRTWYRLTSLAAEAGERFGIEATLNPKEQVLKALGITIPRRELLTFLHDLASRLESDPNMVAASQNVQLSPKVPGVVPRHTVNAPTPPPAVSRVTRNATPLGPQEQEVMNVFDEGQPTRSSAEAETPATPPAVRRQQTGPKAANKIVTGEGIKREEQSAHAYKSANKQDKETGEKHRILGIPDEFTAQNNWPEAVNYLDNHFRAKPQSSSLSRVQRVNLLKTAWIVGNQEVDRDPMALITNALVVKRLKNARENGASPARLTRTFLEIPAAFKGSERAGEILNEDVAGQRSISGERAAIQHRLDGETEDDARRRRNRERRPLNDANRLANRHVQAVSAWMKEFNIESKVEASLKRKNVVGTEDRERAIKELIFNEIEDTVREMYGATRRQ
ncbi:eCIS core domain-containing protein [Streptomyces sp. KR80]|uniref:eCIS core domain-containing protein n=1 Tax=Streptomyces sp. KR80 TaxID=3457426 RepID=UPI003FD4DCDF